LSIIPVFFSFLLLISFLTHAVLDIIIDDKIQLLFFCL